MDAYFAAKARLFQTGLRPGAPAVINGGDAYGRRLLVGLTDVFGYCLRHKLPGGAYPAADWLVGELLADAPDGMRLELRWTDARRVVAAPLIGAFNAENLLAVVALGLGLGMTLEQMDCFGDFPGVPGRLERIGDPHEGRGPHVFVDFAHTPDALHNVLQTLKDVGFPRIITVFGCGGDRDRAKRPLMGEAVARFSDVAVLTSDNPRHEDPLAIMRDALPGLKSGRALRIETEPDRRAAIALALDAARPGDAVLIAGKGHEKTQQIGDVKHPFSDQRIARELLACA
jgi:UDP-N-acetylmuramoyl-L-alanyl-D-glutamate--2,6-diaminopimelate ligase